MECEHTLKFVHFAGIYRCTKCNEWFELAKVCTDAQLRAETAEALAEKYKSERDAWGITHQKDVERIRQLEEELNEKNRQSKDHEVAGSDEVQSEELG